jgi:hypothetical protein
MDYLDEYKDWRGMTGQFGYGFHPSYVDKVQAELKKMELNNKGEKASGAFPEAFCIQIEYLEVFRILCNL